MIEWNNLSSICIIKNDTEQTGFPEALRMFARIKVSQKHCFPIVTQNYGT